MAGDVFVDFLQDVEILAKRSEVLSLADKSTEWLIEEEERIHRQLSTVRTFINAGPRVLIGSLSEDLLLKIFMTVVAVVCVHTDDDDELDMDAISPHAGRLVVVDVRFRFELMEKFSGCLENETWTRLETLTLTLPLRLPIAFSFSDHHLPNFRDFRLDGVVPRSWSSAIFRDLHTLHLENDFHDDSMLPSFEAFLDVLDSCLLLQNLLVRRSPCRHLLSEEVTKYPEPKRVVQLHHLLSLQLDFSQEIDIAYLLAHLVIPQKTRVSINRLRQTTNNGALACLPRSKANFELLKAITSVRVTSDETDIIDGTTATTVYGWFAHDDPKQCLKLDAQHAQHAQAAKEVFRRTEVRATLFEMGIAFPQLQYLKVICLDGARLLPIAEEEWVRILKSLPLLVRLELRMKSAPPPPT
ncbi:hypothetical protein EUX98_g4790 [Antrodiella citrinella]|uniref:F-box domain-containing protein n=1 Tax=Antrodiella citrinella TaxID=2447956 RepID=A0A4S4MUY7_9APHY|nr:hypothetical protein EUX98_g4790 [Antrodiella citrinella]